MSTLFILFCLFIIGASSTSTSESTPSSVEESSTVPMSSEEEGTVVDGSIVSGNWSCVFQNGVISEDGVPRNATKRELKKLRKYEARLAKYDGKMARQMDKQMRQMMRSMRHQMADPFSVESDEFGEALPKMPKMPAAPCLCKKHCGKLVILGDVERKRGKKKASNNKNDD